MTRYGGAVIVAVLVACGGARAEGDKDVGAVLDKGIKALGGEEKLKGLTAAAWKTKGKIYLGGEANEFSGRTTVKGLDHVRQEFEGEFGGNKVQGVTVLAGDKGWRKFGDMKMEMDKDAVANEKRTVYLQMVPMTLLPLKGKGFKVRTAPEEKVGGKPAAALRVTAPDGKEFTLFLDKESGLPVRQVAKVLDFMGTEFTQETTYGGYKDFGGIKKATKVEAKRDGERFIEQEVTEFKALQGAAPKTFAEPE